MLGLRLFGVCLLSSTALTTACTTANHYRERAAAVTAQRAAFDINCTEEKVVTSILGDEAFMGASFEYRADRKD